MNKEYGQLFFKSLPNVATVFDSASKLPLCAYRPSTPISLQELGFCVAEIPIPEGEWVSLKIKKTQGHSQPLNPYQLTM